MPSCTATRPSRTSSSKRSSATTSTSTGCLWVATSRPTASHYAPPPRRRTDVRRLALLLIVLVVTVVAAPAHAHGMRTAYLEIVEAQGGRATVHLRMTAPDPSIGVDAEAGCTLDAAGDSASLFDRAWLLACPGGITGHAL